MTRGGIDGAWPPRGGLALPWSGRDAARQRAGERGGRPGAALGWAGEARGAGAGGSLGRLRLAGQKRGGGPLKQRTFFSISIFNKFSNNSFQILF